MTFTVSIDERDIVFACETGETVLDAAERAGYSLPYSCRKGVCSTCEGELRRGTVSVGSKQFDGPADGVLLCQARPQSDVLIHAKRIERHDPDARKRVTASVYRISRPADDVVILQLRFPAGIRAKFKAGQHPALGLQSPRHLAICCYFPVSIGVRCRRPRVASICLEPRGKVR
jgi:ferredoxin